jgi:hypothetical protein
MSIHVRRAAIRDTDVVASVFRAVVEPLALYNAEDAKQNSRNMMPTACGRSSSTRRPMLVSS